MKHVSLLVPRQEAEALLDWLQEQRVIHVEDASERLSGAGPLKRPSLPTDRVDSCIRELRFICETLERFHALKRPFVSTIVSLPARVSEAERRQVLREFDYRPLYELCVTLSDEHQQHIRAAEAAQAEAENLEFFLTLPFEPEQLRALRRTRAWVGSMSAQAWQEMRLDMEAGELAAMQELCAARGARWTCVWWPCGRTRSSSPASCAGTGFPSARCPSSPCP